MNSDLNVQVDDELPLLDQGVMSEWSSDLEKEVVLDLLSCVPTESYKSLAAIRKATAEGDLTAAKRAAHCLKGMASNLGATRLARIARTIEVTSDDIDDVLAHSATLEATIEATLEAVRAYA